MNKQYPTLLDLQAIPYEENNEALINLKESCPDIICEYRRADSNVQTVLVRTSIATKLQRVQKCLAQHHPKMQLLVVEGYRSPAYQERYYLKQLLTQYNQTPHMDVDLLLEYTHKLVALPSVAGHPTGGAVDLTIAYEKKEIDMGSSIADFSIKEKLPTYSPLVSKEQLARRLLLHDLMLEEGFAPFYGEWWHFSYGDREWAYFYGKQKTFYSPIF